MVAPKVSIEELKRKLVLSCKILYHEGHASDFLGHISVRIPETDQYLIKPTRVGWEELMPEDICTGGLDGSKVDGPHPLPSERWIHIECYKRSKNVQSVIHTHPYYSTIMGTLGIELQPIIREALLFGKGIDVYNSRECLQPEHSTLVDNSQLGAEVANSVGDRKASILKYHGIVTVGKSMEESSFVAVCLERAAKYQLLASSIRGAKPIPKADARLLWKNRLFEEALPVVKATLGTDIYTMSWQHLVKRYGIK